MVKKYHEKIIKRSNEIYNKSSSKYGVSSSAVLWDDEQTQYLRFAELLRDLDLNSPNKTILDIGCGNGELYKFLNFMGFRGHYAGYDINKNLIGQAKERFGNIDVCCVDIMKKKIVKRFDYVLMSGLFNVNMGQSREWCYEFLKKMFLLCKEIMAFNAITTFVNFRENEIFYLNPQEILNFCIRNLSPRVTLAHHNLPYNFTVRVYKEKNWVSINK